MAALRPLLSCRRSLVLNDLAVVSAESIALFVAWISFPRKARLSTLYLLNALDASCLASLLILSLSSFFPPQVYVGEKLDFGDPAWVVCALMDLFCHQVEAGVEFH